MQKIESNAVVDVSTGRKKYVPPQIEVVELDKHAPLLSASQSDSRGAGFRGIDETDW